MVPAAPPLGHQHPEHLVHDRRGRERRPVLPARRKGYAEVLAVELGPGWERNGLRVLDTVEEEGGDLERTVLCHMNPSGEDLEYQAAAAERGGSPAFVMMGRRSLLWVFEGFSGAPLAAVKMSSLSPYRYPSRSISFVCGVVA